MDLWLLIPSTILTLAVLVGTRATGHLHPAVSVRALTVTSAAAAISCLAWAGLVVAGLVVEVGPLAHHDSSLERLVATHNAAPAWAGAVVGTWTLWSAIRVVAVERARRELHRSLPGSAGIVMADSADFVGVAVPGRQARIVLSRPALAGCSRAERSVVVAHEWSHLSGHHAWYARAVGAAATLCPWLRPVERSVRFSIERWADEDAAAAVGDRRLVARTIARLALSSAGDRATLAFTHGDAAARARAMLSPPPVTPTFAAHGIVAGTSAAATSIAGSGLQLHHAIGVL